MKIKKYFLFFVAFALLLSVFIQNGVRTATAAADIVLYSGDGQTKVYKFASGLDYLKYSEYKKITGANMPFLADSRSITSCISGVISTNYADGKALNASGTTPRYRDGGPADFYYQTELIPGWTNALPDGGVLSSSWQNATITALDSSSMYGYNNVSEMMMSFLYWDRGVWQSGQGAQIGHANFDSINYFPVLFPGVSAQTCNTSQAAGKSMQYLRNGESQFFRRDFNLTQDQFDRIDDARLELLADDWVRVYVNGTYVTQDTYIDYLSDGSPMPQELGYANNARGTNDINIKNFLKVGNNVIAFQLINKGIWSINSSGSAMGLYYKAFIGQNATPPSLDVTLSANPSSGYAPLNGVDLTANVTGTTTGNITYKFDCGEDLSNDWELTPVATTTNPYTATDLCNFPNPGTYYARVEVTRNGLTRTATTPITVSTAPVPTISCAIHPVNGIAPLAVEVSTTYSNINNLNSFSYTLGDGTSFSNRPSIIYYTYSQAGTYTITVDHPEYTGTPKPKPCSVQAVVQNPTSGGGGEVSP